MASSVCCDLKKVGNEEQQAYPKDVLCGLLALLEDVNDGAGDIGAAIPVVHHQQTVLCRGHQLIIGGQEGCLIVSQPANIYCCCKISTDFPYVFL